MGESTGIEWTDATWNPIRGCSRVSEGCRNCYAERVAARFSGPGQPYEGLADRERNGSKWTGEVRLIHERLADPLRWKKPRRIFVNSMSDLFHESLTNEQIAAVFGVMAACPRHTFIVLTKRAERMKKWFDWVARQSNDSGPRWHPAALHCARAAFDALEWDERLNDTDEYRAWPLPNVILGVSAENQAAANQRIPYLLDTPAAVRLASVEPMLGPVDLTNIRCGPVGIDALAGLGPSHVVPRPRLARIDWVIAGCESGPGARSADVAWFRLLRDQCAAAGVPFFLKQAHEDARPFLPLTAQSDFDALRTVTAGPGSHRKPGGIIGAPYLDGVQWLQFPEVRR